MPFDGNEVRVEAVAILDRVKARLATPERWLQHAWEHGDRVCLVGAFNKATERDVAEWQVPTAPGARAAFLALRDGAVRVSAEAAGRDESEGGPVFALCAANNSVDFAGLHAIIDAARAAVSHAV